MAEIFEVVKSKKRGRKPKGGKILSISDQKPTYDNTYNNIILHLKCNTKNIKKNAFLSEFNYNPKLEQVEAYSNTSYTYSIFQENKTQTTPSSTPTVKPNDNSKDIHEKIKKLQLNFDIQNYCNKKSACFWCVHTFNNPVVYIPKHKNNDRYEVYGYFCSPSCAVAYLYKENITTSVKWERYAMIYSLYNEIYKYNSTIKPAPDPYYLLSIFLGTLSIDEYRELCNSNSTFLILDKPITRIIPEITEASDSFDIHSRFQNSNKSSNKSNMYRLTRSENGSHEKSQNWNFIK